MIRVGNKPQLYFVESHNDMSHFSPSHWAVTDYHYMGLMDYMEKLQFDQFDMSKLEVEANALKSGELNAIMASMMNNTYGQQLNRMLAKSKGQIWQYDAVSSDLKGYVRHCVVLGGNTLQVLTWTDAHVKLPLFRLAANILNKLRIFKVEKEIKAWDRFVGKVYDRK